MGRMELDFDTPVAIKDVWRANYVTNDNFSVTFRPKFYNINSVGPLNFHVTSENTPTLPTFTPIEEVVNNVEECVEASVNLQHGWVQEDGIRKNNVLIQAGTDLSIKEWYIRLNYNDPSIVTSVTV